MSELRVVSPTLSQSTAITSTTVTSSSESSATATSTVTAGGVNYSELFAEVDWSQVNLLELESEWRAELEQIERENVQALMDSTSKAQVVLPAVFKAIEEMSKLSVIYDEYANDLRITGMEIQQIEQLNKGLETQTRNQQLLLQELQKIINVVALPDDVLDSLQNLSLDAPRTITKVERAARELYSILNVKFEGGIQDIKAVSDRLRYYNEQHDLFAKRLVNFLTTQLAEMASKSASSSSSLPGSRGPSSSSGVTLPKHDEVSHFLLAYRPLILLCKVQSPREHLDICAAFQNSFGSMITRDLGRLFDTLKASHLLKRPTTEPSSIFISPSAKAATSFSALTAVGRSFSASTKNFSTMQLLKSEDLPFVGDSEFIYADQIMHFIILVVAMHIENSRRLVAQMLFGCDNIDPAAMDLKMNRKIQAIIAVLYSSLGEKLPNFISQCIKLDESCAVEMLAVLDVRSPQIPGEISIFGKILEAVQQTLQSYAEFFLESQIEAIKSTKYSAKKRSGVFSYVETFPRFINRIENNLHECGVSSSAASVRSLVNRYFEKIGQCIFDSFQNLMAEVEEDDEKGRINASVMTIENSHYLYKELKDMNLPLLDPIVRNARTFYEQSLTSYASLSIYRVLHRYTEYFEGLANLLKTTAPEEVAFTSTYSKASVKKMLNSVTLKDIKKAVEMLHQRVLKHFADQPQMISIVWKAVQDDFIGRQNGTINGLAKVFPGANDLAPPFSITTLNEYFTELSKRQ